MLLEGLQAVRSGKVHHFVFVVLGVGLGLVGGRYGCMAGGMAFFPPSIGSGTPKSPDAVSA